MIEDTTRYHSCRYPLEWKECYDKDSYYSKYITPESFGHPAKMSWGLLQRIFKHLKEMRLVTPDTTIVDFMAGTFRTGIMAELHGYKSIGIELEPHFIEMIEGNKKQFEKRTGRQAQWEVMQGDARQLSEMLKEKGYCGVVSPPYQDALSSNQDWSKDSNRQKPMEEKGIFRDYSKNPKNISNLKDMPLVGITSPPYGECLNEKKNTTSNLSREERLRTAGHTPENYMGGTARNCSLEDGLRYSHNPDNIGNLPDRQLVGITSPPYVEAMDKRHDSPRARELMGDKDWTTYYSKSENNIGNLKESQLVGITSPPYEASFDRGSKPSDIDKAKGLAYMVNSYNRDNPNNLGTIGDNSRHSKEQEENYLSAMLQVYSEAYRSGISPLILVTKNPTRNGKLRDLAGDTIRILQQSGYEIFDYHHAILFTEQTQATLDGETFKKPKGRLSFFKRLSYQKGNAVAKHEDIIFARIPNRQSSMTGITSPPYGISETSQESSIHEINRRIERGIKGAVIRSDGKAMTGSGKYQTIYSKNPANIGNLPDKQLVGIVSPPYENTEIAINCDMTNIELRKKLRANGQWQGYNLTNPANIGNLRDKEQK